MIKTIKTVTLLITTILFFNCSDNEETSENKPDKEKPTININYEGGFPRPCDVLERGETYTIRVNVSDNIGLATYAIDLHNNFDHHTHDDQGSKCNLEPTKTPDNPLILMENYDIKQTPKTYEISQSITIPKDIDTGDYHCQISVIDVTGWQSRTSVDIKIE